MIAREMFASAPWRESPIPWSDSRFPPGLMGGHESALLLMLARDYFTGVGAIIDAGAMLGRSSALLAQGVRENPRVKQQRWIHCYDWFLVNDDTHLGFIRAHAGPIEAGGSTRHFYDANTARWRDLIEVHEGDFGQAIWSGEPIEILFLDICKQGSLNRRAIEQFFPALIPGRSVVIHQDYHHCHLPYIHTSMEMLHDYFEPVAVRVDASCVWRLHKPIPSEVVQDAATVRKYPAAHQLALMDRALLRLPEPDRGFVALARAMLLMEHFGRDLAIAAWLELPDVARDVDQASWTFEREQALMRITGGSATAVEQWKVSFVMAARVLRRLGVTEAEIARLLATARDKPASSKLSAKGTD